MHTEKQKGAQSDDIQTDRWKQSQTDRQTHMHPTEEQCDLHD